MTDRRKLKPSFPNLERISEYSKMQIRNMKATKDVRYLELRFKFDEIINNEVKREEYLQSFEISDKNT